jgi:hypothetical protein
MQTESPVKPLSPSTSLDIKQVGSIPPTRFDINGKIIFADYYYRTDLEWITDRTEKKNISYEVPKRLLDFPKEVSPKDTRKYDTKPRIKKHNTSKYDQMVLIYHFFIYGDSSYFLRILYFIKYESHEKDILEYNWKGRMKCMYRPTKVGDKLSEKLRRSQEKDAHFPTDGNIWVH